MAITKRWSVINKKTQKARASFTTRDSARSNKRSTEYIFDNYELRAVR